MIQNASNLVIQRIQIASWNNVTWIQIEPTGIITTWFVTRMIPNAINLVIQRIQTVNRNKALISLNRAYWININVNYSYVCNFVWLILCIKRYILIFIIVILHTRVIKDYYNFFSKKKTKIIIISKSTKYANSLNVQHKQEVLLNLF